MSYEQELNAGIQRNRFPVIAKDDKRFFDSVVDWMETNEKTAYEAAIHFNVFEPMDRPLLENSFSELTQKNIERAISITGFSFTDIQCPLCVYLDCDNISQVTGARILSNIKEVRNSFLNTNRGVIDCWRVRSRNEGIFSHGIPENSGQWKLGVQWTYNDEASINTPWYIITSGFRRYVQPPPTSEDVIKG